MGVTQELEKGLVGWLEEDMPSWSRGGGAIGSRTGDVTEEK